MTAEWETYFDPIARGSKGTTGDTGSDGTNADTGDWTTTTSYSVNDRCYHTKTGYGQCVYRCTSAHTSGASTEPEVGGSWGTVWELFVEGGHDGAGSGDVVGPSSSTTDDDVGFADTSGKLLKSMGPFATRLNTALAALTASTATPDGDVDTLPLKIAAGQRRVTVDTLFKRYVSITITAAAFFPATTSPCSSISQVETSTNDHNYKVLGFPHTSKTYANTCFPLPDGYDGGTIKAHIWWHSSGTTSNSVLFGIQASAIGDNDPMDPSWGTAVEVSDAATGTAYKNLKTAVLDSIAIQTPRAAPAGGELCSLRIYRDPTNSSDNLDASINFVAVKLIIGVNKQSEV